MFFMYLRFSWGNKHEYDKKLEIYYFYLVLSSSGLRTDMWLSGLKSQSYICNMNVTFGYQL
jgi:hypothetical protein